MKKRLALSLALIMLFSAIFAVTAEADNGTSSLGDVNSNGSVEKYDYILVKRAVLKTVTLSDAQTRLADVNRNGSVEKYDYILIKRICLGTYELFLGGGTRFSDLSELDKEDCKILILGNSFVATSKVGDVMNDLFLSNGKDCYAYSVSIGNAGVNTFVKDKEMMADIRAGYYDAVFICGFYGTWELDPCSVLYDTCINSDTKLVIFPAYNEDSATIDAASRFCKKAYLLDWKSELDALIASGVDKWELCYNDQHLHSTPAAGYVAAHMTYRAIFGEVPKHGVSYPVSQAEMNALLGDYIDSGLILASGK